MKRFNRFHPKRNRVIPNPPPRYLDRPVRIFQLVSHLQFCVKLRVVKMSQVRFVDYNQNVSKVVDLFSNSLISLPGWLNISVGRWESKKNKGELCIPLEDNTFWRFSAEICRITCLVSIRIYFLLFCKVLKNMTNIDENCLNIF